MGFRLTGLSGGGFRAPHLKRQGWSRHDIAEALGVSPRERQPLVCSCPATAARELSAPRRGPRRPPKLSPAQKAPDPGSSSGMARRLTGFRGEGLDLCPSRPSDRRGVGRPLPQGPRRPAAPGVALDAPGADPPCHPAGRGSHHGAGGMRSGRTYDDGRGASAECWFFEGRIGVLPTAGGGPDVCPPRALTPVLREKVTRPHLSHGRNDA